MSSAGSPALLPSLSPLPAALPLLFPTCCPPACCRGSEATAEELATLQERALWEMLQLFFLEGAGDSGALGPVAQVRAAAVVGVGAAVRWLPGQLCC